MPRLVKGGKYVFGWSRVERNGTVAIPPEALDEYRMNESENLILMPGSRTSGGFGLSRSESLIKNPLGEVLKARPGLREYEIPEGRVIEYKDRPFCWIRLNRGHITIPPRTLGSYGLRAGDKLLVIRGSGRAIAFITKGPITEEAEKHKELPVFDPYT